MTLYWSQWTQAFGVLNARRAPHDIGPDLKSRQPASYARSGVQPLVTQTGVHESPTTDTSMKVRTKPWSATKENFVDGNLKSVQSKQNPSRSTKAKLACLFSIQKNGVIAVSSQKGLNIAVCPTRHRTVMSQPTHNHESFPGCQIKVRICSRSGTLLGWHNCRFDRMAMKYKKTVILSSKQMPDMRLKRLYTKQSLIKVHKNVV